MVYLFPRGVVAWAGLLMAGLVGGAIRADAAEKGGKEAVEKLFVQRVLPLLKEKCLACHGDDPKKIRGGLDMRSRKGLLEGGERGKSSLVPGEPDRSLIHVAVTRAREDLVMPPKENDRLSAEQVGWIREWIAGGAPWPDASRWSASGTGVTVKTSGGLSPEWTARKYQPEDLWAYQPVRRPALPSKLVDPARVNNPIDAFIQAKLASKGIGRLAEPADRRTLMRRVTLDLTGLPPTPAEVEAFVADEAPGAFGRLVDRLLESPHYGEQMARQWLDVARYADTAGFSNDFARPAAWRYRDYVVRSFGEDKPYDRFILEQLAGDELDPKDPRMLVATGFLRMGPWEHTGMSVAAVTRQQYLDDITHNVGVTFLAQGLRCARCHDHKFDPIPTRDYYRIQAVFATTQPIERPAAFLPWENVSGFADMRAGVEKQLSEASAELARLQKKNQQAVAALLKKAGVARYDDLPVEDRARRDTYGLTALELTLKKIFTKRKQIFERELGRFEPLAFSVYDGPFREYRSPRPPTSMPAQSKGQTPEVRILAGGSLEAPLEAVTPGVLSVAHRGEDAIPARMEGRRLALGRWIASKENPLTARVIVNRVWQWHFGKGLVATSSNFGKMGAKPTHPELLDWLAVWFVEHGWSIKSLHRLILASATYQQAGIHPEMERVVGLDARNDLLAYFPPRRLAAEEIRDAMLAITGELSREMGGPPVYPEISWEVAFQPRHLMGSPAPAYQPSQTPAQRNRRTLYAARIRTLADPMLEVFNRPGSEVSCERRDETTVTPQVFALFNSEMAHSRALALAVRLEKEAETTARQIQLAFRLMYGRGPTVEEEEACAAHVARMTAHHRLHRPKVRELPTSIERHMIEELTGKNVIWEEPLPWVKDYQRDTMPWEVSASTRGLAELCLVLFSSNELLYVR